MSRRQNIEISQFKWVTIFRTVGQIYEFGGSTMMLRRTHKHFVWSVPNVLFGINRIYLWLCFEFPMILIKLFSVTACSQALMMHSFTATLVLMFLLKIMLPRTDLLRIERSFHFNHCKENWTIGKTVLSLIALLIRRQNLSLSPAAIIFRHVICYWQLLTFCWVRWHSTVYRRMK